MRPLRLAALAAFANGGADARVLAGLRMGTAALVLADVFDRLRDFHAHYTAAGLAPATLPGARFSLLTVSDEPGFALAGFGLTLAAALLVLFGLYTRAALPALFLALLSVQHRNPFVEDGGDAVLIALVFWMMFIDVGARWSLDVRLGRRPLRTLVAAAPVRVLQLQIAAIYLFAFLTKTGVGWNDGSAVARVLGSSDWARGVGPWLAGQEGLCRALSRATLVVEGGFAPLVFLPSLLPQPWRQLRWLPLAGGLALHVGIFFSMRLGVFSLVMPLSYLAFVSCFVMGKPAPADLPRAQPWLVAGLSALFGLVVVGQVSALGGWRLPRPLAAPLEALGLRQDWRMFAPDAPHLDVRWTAPGEFADGSRADLVATTLVGLGQHHGFRYSRWHRLRNALVAQPAPLLASLGRFTCRRLPTLVRFELHAHVTPVPRAGGPSETTVRLRQACTSGQ